ncbi:LacI family DNA-binding transcriptional regulator [Falsirhodobacter deserti]|uniref:LacI family DNA-binding transcriptional regulator n=1 Tax=Falsirhodobacter deserti TaxID=1365611 RepID=UPI000FE34312|nr:LacI family DNA-binding transcriptional regulator [Falsirhodobacter deserti]
MTKNTPRVRDVARLAKVSTATVSRTLTRPDLVSETTRKLVMKAVEETGYTVNISAQNLRRQRTGSILALVPNLGNPFFTDILGGINVVLRERKLNLLVADTTGTSGTRVQMAALAHRSRADGLVVMDGTLAPEVFSHSACPPFVQACEWNGQLDAPRVVADNHLGAGLATRHLIALGHRRIAQLFGPEENPLTITRCAGFADALQAAGLPHRAEWMIEGDFSMGSGQAAARRILAMKDRPTAVFCHSDGMAFGLMAELQRNGVRVPLEFSVAGFDDIELAEHATPGLTTIRQERAEIGATAARTLLAILKGAVPEAATVLPVRLVERGSTGPAPA